MKPTWLQIILGLQSWNCTQFSDRSVFSSGDQRVSAGESATSLVGGTHLQCCRNVRKLHVIQKIRPFASEENLVHTMAATAIFGLQNTIVM